MGPLSPPLSVEKGRPGEKSRRTSQRIPETRQIRGPTEKKANSGPARRIRRPTSIRRPKLIGKSFEGAAVHAVAASRARASNRFRAQPPLVAKIPSRHLARTPRQASIPESWETEDRSGDEQSEEATIESSQVSLLQSEYAGKTGKAWAGLFKQSPATMSFIMKHWFSKSTIYPSRLYLLSLSQRLWNDVAVVQSMTWKVAGKDFVLSFSSYLKNQLQVLGPTIATEPDATSSSGFIISKLKRLGSITFLLIVRVALHKRGRFREINCDTWMTQFALDSNSVPLKRSPNTKSREKRMQSLDMKVRWSKVS